VVLQAGNIAWRRRLLVQETAASIRNSERVVARTAWCS
jgi:hypothetical protein